MKPLILVTGGARSGKSQFAEKKAKELSESILYIATGLAFDEGMKDRIKDHKSRRPKDWATLEKYRDFQNITREEDFKSRELLIVDCVTLMVSNLMLASGLDFDHCPMDKIRILEKSIVGEIEGLIRIIREYDKQAILVTNEVGMGLVPAYKMGNIFRDIAGRVNQYIAKEADEVYLTVSGIEMKIK